MTIIITCTNTCHFSRQYYIICQGSAQWIFFALMHVICAKQRTHRTRCSGVSYASCIALWPQMILSSSALSCDCSSSFSVLRIIGSVSPFFFKARLHCMPANKSFQSKLPFWTYLSHFLRRSLGSFFFSVSFALIFSKYLRPYLQRTQSCVQCLLHPGHTAFFCFAIHIAPLLSFTDGNKAAVYFIMCESGEAFRDKITFEKRKEARTGAKQNSCAKEKTDIRRCRLWCTIRDSNPGHPD
ncbi:MAG: hypothetical protein IJ337_04835 [Clostridia bacterium]|nr:hypothetical protein [Clostridia bacterium]